MTTEENKELVRRFFEAIENENYEKLAEFCHKDFVFYPQMAPPFPGVEGLIESEKKNFDAFPDFSMPIIEMIAERDLVTTYFVFKGTHTGTPFFGVPATGNSVRFSLMILLQIADGKFLEQRSHVDVHDILKQLQGCFTSLIDFTPTNAS